MAKEYKGVPGGRSEYSTQRTEVGHHPGRRFTLQYFEMGPMERRDAEEALASGDEERMCSALMRSAVFDQDWPWVQEQCLKFCHHHSDAVKQVAVLCLGHLARIHRVLALERVLPVLNSLAETPGLTGRVQDALDDIRIYLDVPTDRLRVMLGAQLTRSEISALFRTLAHIYQFPPGRFVTSDLLVDQSVEDLLLPEIRQVLANLPISEGDEVLVVLNATEGFRTTWGTLLDLFDDLWFPARDDLLAVAPALGWVVTLSHEERLTVGRMPK